MFNFLGQVHDEKSHILDQYEAGHDASENLPRLWMVPVWLREPRCKESGPGWRNDGGGREAKFLHFPEDVDGYGDYLRQMVKTSYLYRSILRCPYRGTWMLHVRCWAEPVEAHVWLSTTLAGSPR